MTDHFRKLLFIHAVAFILILVTWLAGASIAPHAGTPLVALYYVLHIFPASVIFVLILFQWQISSQARRAASVGVQWSDRFNRSMHQLYDAILIALPLTGLLVFFEPTASHAPLHENATWWIRVLQDRLFYHVHAWLFDLLLGFVALNVGATLAMKWRAR